MHSPATPTHNAKPFKKPKQILTHYLLVAYTAPNRRGWRIAMRY
jgi:hypothetical protein